jgi:hypothetical protein
LYAFPGANRLATLLRLASAAQSRSGACGKRRARRAAGRKSNQIKANQAKKIQLKIIRRPEQSTSEIKNHPKTGVNREKNAAKT